MSIKAAITPILSLLGWITSFTLIIFLSAIHTSSNHSMPHCIMPLPRPHSSPEQFSHPTLQPLPSSFYLTHFSMQIPAKTSNLLILAAFESPSTLSLPTLDLILSLPNSDIMALCIILLCTYSQYISSFSPLPEHQLWLILYLVTFFCT